MAFMHSNPGFYGEIELATHFKAISICRHTAAIAIRPKPQNAHLKVCDCILSNTKIEN